MYLHPQCKKFYAIQKYGCKEKELIYDTGKNKLINEDIKKSKNKKDDNDIADKYEKKKVSHMITPAKENYKLKENNTNFKIRKRKSVLFEYHMLRLRRYYIQVSRETNMNFKERKRKSVLLEYHMLKQIRQNLNLCKYYILELRESNEFNELMRNIVSTIERNLLIIISTNDKRYSIFEYFYFFSHYDDIGFLYIDVMYILPPLTGRRLSIMGSETYGEEE